MRGVDVGRRGLSRAAGLLGAALVAGLAASCASTDEALHATGPAPLEAAELGALDPVFRCGDLYLSSEPDAGELELAARRGFRAVIDLRSDGQVAAQPLAADARRLGLDYLHEPVDPAALDDAAVDRVLAALDAAALGDGPVLLFGDTGDRSAAVFAIHRAVVQGVSVDEALADGRAAGMKPGATEAQVVRQVERLRNASAASAEATSADTTDSTPSSSRQDGGNA